MAERRSKRDCATSRRKAETGRSAGTEAHTGGWPARPHPRALDGGRAAREDRRAYRVITPGGTAVISNRWTRSPTTQLALASLAAAALAGLCGSAPADPPPARLPLLGDAEAWARLPHRDPPLPAWARALAGPLPRTTAAM